MPRVLATPGSGGRWYPFLRIRLKAGPNQEYATAMLDSGADESSIPANLLTVLGVKKSTLQPAGQMSGIANLPLPYFKAHVQMFWKNWKIADEIGVLPAHTPILLGRNDFFARFVVTFDWSHNPPIMDINPVAKKR